MIPDCTNILVGIHNDRDSLEVGPDKRLKSGQSEHQVLCLA